MRLLLILPCLLAALLVACGGGGGNKTPTPPASETTSPEALRTAEAAIPDPFASLNSYNYDVKVLADGQFHSEIKGSVQAPDRIAMDAFASASGQPIESVIIIGNQHGGKTALLKTNGLPPTSALLKATSPACSQRTSGTYCPSIS